MRYSSLTRVGGTTLVFEPFEPTEAEAKNDSLVLQKVVFIVCNLATLALGLYKCR